jgi:LPXTG-motif cell wall-anchored protein
VETVILVRLFFFLAAPAHWALGLSPVRFRPFVIGSAIGFVPGMLLVSFAGRPLYEWLSRQSREAWLALAGLSLLGAAALWLLKRRRTRSADLGD